VAHRVQAGQRVRIIGLEIAVPADADTGQLADEVSVLLSESGVDSAGSQILDWRYTFQDWEVQVGVDPEEGEVFHLPRWQVKHFA
jgi:hypothetical protein